MQLSLELKSAWPDQPFVEVKLLEARHVSMGMSAWACGNHGKLKMRKIARAKVPAAVQ